VIALAARLRPSPARLALVLAGVVVAVWAPSLAAPFQFDDWSVIVGDPRVASLAAWWDAMPATRPLVKLLYALGHEAGGAPIVYRGVNVAWHALNAALVFVLMRRLARRMRIADADGALRIGAFTALVFALHPVQTESVTYVSGGSQAMATGFALLSLLAFTGVIDAQGRAARQAGFALAAALAFAAAIAVRESAIATPLACLLWWRAEGGGRGRGPIVAVGAMSVVAAGAAVAAWLTTAYPYLWATSFGVRSWAANLLAQGDAVAWLMGQLVRWDRLNADPALVADTSLSVLNVARAGLLVALIVAAAWQWNARRAVAFGVLWFFLWLAPTHSLVPRLDLANERHLYLALVGPAWLLAVVLARWRTQGLVLAAVLAVSLAFATALRNRVYANEVVFWQDVVAKSPRNARASNNLGMALAAACQPLAAARAFDDAARLAPDDPRPRINAELLARGELPGVPASCAGSAGAGADGTGGAGRAR